MGDFGSHSVIGNVTTFDRAHASSYSVFIETMHLFCTIF